MSRRNIIGIFNRETIEISDMNDEYKDEIDQSARSVIIDSDDEVITSPVSSATLIEREAFIDTDFLWKRRP
ncbi:MAG: hypothetical protein ACOC2H_04075 [Spirochaetota bacterium]